MGFFVFLGRKCQYNSSGIAGRDHRQGDEDFFSKKKIGGADFFQKKLGRRRLFFTTNLENPRFHFSKKAIFEDQK